ncbi:unnamed protein product, partial [Darwinula stevensoni]
GIAPGNCVKCDTIPKDNVHEEMYKCTDSVELLCRANMEASALIIFSFLLFPYALSEEGEKEVYHDPPSFPSTDWHGGRHPPTCGTRKQLSPGQSFPIVSVNRPERHDHYSFCSWRFKCSEDMALQCSSFQLPQSRGCRESAFVYNGRRLWNNADNHTTDNHTTDNHTTDNHTTDNHRAHNHTDDTLLGYLYGKRYVGIQAANETDLDRIIGGTPVPNQGKYPWMIHMTDLSFFCGGSLINDRYVLTAAHCIGSKRVPSTKTFFVTLGDLDRSTTSESESVQIKATAIVFPTWDPNNFSKDDIALLKLETPVDFQRFPHIRPICLSSSAIPVAGETVTVAGWGRTNEGGTTGPVSEKLMETTLQVISEDTCRGFFGSIITNNIVCAQQAGRDICQGDSGGPLMQKTATGFYQCVGVNSFVATGCLSQFGGGFTKTANYVDSFIKANTQDAVWCSVP